MANNRKDCPKHTTGNGRCYCQYHKDSDKIYHAPQDVKDNMSNIYSVLRGRPPEKITPYCAALVRLANVNFIRGRLSTLSGLNLSRAFETINNLCE
jgi:hypothetical protein